MKEIEIELGGAVTVLNAMGLGIGSAIGTSVEHKLSIKQAEELIIDLNPQSDEKLINSCIDIFQEKFDIKVEKVHLTTDLRVPPAKGLKSSSIVATGLISLLSSYYSKSLDPFEIIKMGANASINAGVSITGAIDDALASFSGGFYVTNNQTNEILANHKLDLDKSVILMIPKSSNPKSEIEFELNYLDRYVLKQVVKDAVEGDWRGAIEKNSRVYGQFFLEDWDIINNVNDRMKGITGLNGAGPSLFVICDTDNLQHNKTILSDEFRSYRLHTTKLRFS